MEDPARKIRIVEVPKDSISLPKLSYRYMSSHYYDLAIYRKIASWSIDLTLRPFEKTFEKTFESKFFEEFVEEPRIFAAEMDGTQVGWIELGYHKWNNRMRVWEFLVKEEFRRKGIGTLLMNCAVAMAKERGARMLVLETQSCNAPAISFYLKRRFELIGFDATAYSNEDIQRKEIRLELGLRL